MKKLTLAFCVLTFSSSIAYAANVAEQTGNIAAGKAKATTCIACHGANGNGGANPLWPKLAGQHYGYLVKQLQAFHTKGREDPSMNAMTAPLSDADVYNLAAFFANQPRTKGAPSVGELLEMGRTIYRGGNKTTKVAACIACHGPKGFGNPAASYPAISGQKAAYVEKQLQDFKSGARKLIHNVIIMHDVAIRMSDEEMAAVSNYIEGL